MDSPRRPRTSPGDRHDSHPTTLRFFLVSLLLIAPEDARAVTFSLQGKQSHDELSLGYLHRKEIQSACSA